MSVTYDPTNADGNVIALLKDMANGGSSSTPLALAAASKATRTGADTNLGTGKSLIIGVTLANKVGTPTFTLSVQMKLNSGAYFTIWTAAAALSANGTAVYALGSASVDASSYTEKKQILIPKTFRVVLTYAGNGTTDAFDTAVDLDIV